MNRLLILLACWLLALNVARAEGPDEHYIRIYQALQEADRLNDLGDKRSAATKYIETRQALERFRGMYPGWNERVVNYRLGYIETKLSPLTATTTPGVTPPATTPITPTPNVTAPTVPPTTVTSPAAVASTTLPPMTNAAPNTNAAMMSAEYDQIRALQAQIEQLKADNKTLAAKLKEALSTQPAPVDPRDLERAEERIRTLLKENELVKAQIALLKQSPTATPPPPEMTTKVAEQNETLAALRAENEILKKQTAEWRDKYAALATEADTSRKEFATKLAEKDAAVTKLTAENTGLVKQIELWKQVAENNQRQNALAPIPAMPPDAQRELLALRARVQALEAKPVPYTPEELALFEKPAASVAVNMAVSTAKAPTSTGPASTVPPIEKAPAKVSRGIPPGAGPLLRAAERAFATMQYGEAEKKYLEVLNQDPNNVTLLGNLASTQVELGRLDEAEKYAQRAIALDSEDYFSLYVLGRIRYRQNKLDEALDALSRSVQANVNYADSQNYLGIVLSEKGQRGPAEAALRRALQLQPDNAVAHNNLAVVYATQQPPARALARWHYQKARDAGHPRNSSLEAMLEGK